MKRTLDVLDENAEALPPAPLFVRIGAHILSVSDTGDGTAARRFADALVGAGAASLEAPTDACSDMRVVIRHYPRSPKARLHAEALEKGADLVLGSARLDFATRLASWLAVR